MKLQLVSGSGGLFGRSKRAQSLGSKAQLQSSTSPSTFTAIITTTSSSASSGASSPSSSSAAARPIETPTSAPAPLVSRRRAVSFRDEDGLHSDLVAEIFPAFSQEEYDREPLETDLSNNSKQQIYKELITFHEKEMIMRVHAQSKQSVKHAYLHGKQHKTQEELRRRVRELNSRAVAPAAPSCGRITNLAKNGGSKQRQMVLKSF